MKINMKLLAAIGSAALIALGGCTRVSDLEDRIEEVEGRVDALETLCLKLNTDITALHTLVQAQTEANIYISNVEDVENGYKITFSNGKTYVIQDGDKGSKGDKGEEGAAPVVSVRQDTDGGYYWTLNGEWLLVDGNKVSALGVTPQLRINSEAGNWEVSYDGGTTWSTVAAAYDKSHEITISQDDNAVYFKLADGTVFTVNKAIAYKFFVEQTEEIAILPGETVELAYTIADGDESVKFSVQCSGGYSAVVVPASVSAGVIKVTAPTTLPTEGGHVLVFATKNSTGDVKAQQLSFEKGVITASEVSYAATAEGGNVYIPVSTNLQYTVEIPEAAQSWISVAPATKAVRQDTVTLVVSQNIGAARSADVTLKPNMGAPVTLTIAQAAASGIASFEVDKTAAEVAGNDTTYTIKLTSTVNWTVTASEGVTVTPASGAGSADIVMTFAANSSLDNKATHTATITTEDSEVTEKTITVTVTQGTFVSPYNFTYVRWGNNVGLDIKKYPAMYRVEMGGEAIKVPILESDIPEGAEVAFKWTKHSNVSSKPMKADLDKKNGTVTITPIAESSQVIGVHEGMITVTVGGDSPYAVTKSFPFFVDQQGVNTEGYRVQADPFVFVVNPTTGGTSGAITCTKDGAATEVFNIDFRRNLAYWNYYGPSTYKDGNLSADSYMYLFWNKYYTATGKTLNMASVDPVSYWNNAGGNLEAPLLYIDPATKQMSIKPGTFVDADGNAASGVFYGTMQYNVTEGQNPITTSLGEVRPMAIYFDPTFE